MEDSLCFPALLGVVVIVHAPFLDVVRVDERS